MPVVTYVDPDTIHNPASGSVPGANWFTTHEANFRSIEGRVSCRIYASTAEDFAIPGPTTINLDTVDWNNGMSTATADSIVVPASYAGKYLLSAQLRVVSVPSGIGNYVQMAIAINGTDTFMEIHSRAGVTGSEQAMGITAVAALSVSDVISVRVTTNALSDADTFIGNSFSALSAVWLSA